MSLLYINIAIPGSAYGIASRGIVLESINCTGNESSLYSCPTSPLGLITNPVCLDEGRAASVNCTRICYDGQTRIAGNNFYSGRVEVCLGNRWGTICDQNWNDVAAAVACRNSKFLGKQHINRGV